MSEDVIISADSHMTEPPDLWVERIDREFRDRAPRVVVGEHGGKHGLWFVCEGLEPRAVAGTFAAGKSPEELAQFQKAGWEEARPGGWDPAERCAKRGLKGAMIMASPPEPGDYSEAKYDPFWAAAQDLNMPLSLHTSTGHGRESRYNVNRYMRAMTLPHETQRSLTMLIFSGVLERFPGLKIVSAENDIGWVAHFLYRADFTAQKFRYTDPAPIKLLPSEYFQRQIFATFMNDPVGIANWQIAGKDNMMWSSDYPHTLATWPHSREVIARDFAGVPAEVKANMIRNNAQRLYGLLS